MAKSYIIIDSRGRASIHDERSIKSETTTRLGSGESFQVFEASPLEVEIQFTAASGKAVVKGTRKRGRPAGKKKTRKAAGKKAGRKASKGKKTGKVGRPRLNVGSCTQPGCKNPSKTRGLCSAHYQKHRRLVQDGKPGLIGGGVAKKAAGAKKKAGRKAAGAKKKATSRRKKKKAASRKKKATAQPAAAPAAKPAPRKK